MCVEGVKNVSMLVGNIFSIFCNVWYEDITRLSRAGSTVNAATVAVFTLCSKAVLWLGLLLYCF
jgi:hypothetical protein